MATVFVLILRSGYKNIAFKRVRYRNSSLYERVPPLQRREIRSKGSNIFPSNFKDFSHRFFFILPDLPSWIPSWILIQGAKFKVLMSVWVFRISYIVYRILYLRPSSAYWTNLQWGIINQSFVLISLLKSEEI